MHLHANFAETYGPWAVVTGASSGIGLEFARHLAAAGLNIVLTARRLTRLEALAAQLCNDYPIQTRIVTADLSKPDATVAIDNACHDIQVGLVVANAGFELHGSFFRSSMQDYSDMINVNCVSPTALALTFGRKMADERRGGIILVSSVASVPTPWWATYSGTKGYVTNLGLCLREELQPRGVNVMVLEPGLVKSEMSDVVGKTVSFKRMGLVQQPTDECVREALQSFIAGVSRVTPGFLNKLFFMFLRLFPSGIAIKMLAFSLDRAIDKTIMQY